jgi:hypothetical protein
MAANNSAFFERIAPASKPTGAPSSPSNIYSVADGIDDFGELVKGAPRPVELTPARARRIRTRPGNASLFSGHWRG